MTAEQIRKLVSHSDNWDGGYDQNRMILFGEIAAQLAELNEHLRLTTPNKTPRSRYEGL